MRFINAESVADALPYDALIEALDAAFEAGANTPERTIHRIGVEGAADGTLLMMPCWQSGGRLGVKLATVFPDNARHGKPAVHAGYFLMDAASGEPLAVLDGVELTSRRTAAASALASRYLSREDAGSLLMVGTGRLAPHMIAAHAAVRPIYKVSVWGRRAQAAQSIVDHLADPAYSIESVSDLEAAVRQADIICCATLAKEPLVRGAWLREGQHLDLVGAYTPDRREADSAAVARAALYVDTYGGALAEAGDVIQAIGEGAITESAIVGDLGELARGECAGRSSNNEITLFKSVGTALEDLAAAELVMRSERA